MSPTQWVAVDWGTTNLRAWRIGPDDIPAESVQGGRGMNALDPDEFEPELLDLIGPWLDESHATPILICGMAGARQGWREAPYMEIPANIGQLAEHTLKVPARDSRIVPRIIPGLCQMSESDPDVMRGEETQLAGLNAKFPAYHGLVCLPGTHAKWVQMQAGDVLGFTSMMTGELFQLIRDHSILRHSMADTGDIDAEGFQTGVRAARKAKGQLQSRIFKIRAGDLLIGRAGNWNRSYLSGLLIGAEIVAATAEGTAENITLIGAEKIAILYARALEILGHTATQLPAGEATLMGLVSIYRDLEAKNAWADRESCPQA